MSWPLARIGLAALALALGGFLVVQLVAEHRLESARSRIERPAFQGGVRALPTAERERLVSRLDDAAAVRPGTDALLVAAEAELAAGQSRRAESIARRMVGREPERFEGWVLLALSLRATRPVEAAAALRRAHAISPLSPLPRLR